MKKFLFSILFFNTSHLFSQKIWDIMAITGEYRIVNRNNIFGIGSEFRINKEKLIPIYIGIKTFHTSVNNKKKIFPQLNISYNPPLTHMGISITPYYIEPQIGISGFGTFVLNTGYSISIDKNKYLEGFTFGIQANLPIKSNSEYYDNKNMP